jgi:hypothetical protein
VVSQRLQKANHQPPEASGPGCQLFATVVNGKPGAEQKGMNGLRRRRLPCNRTMGIHGQIGRRDVARTVRTSRQAGLTTASESRGEEISLSYHQGYQRRSPIRQLIIDVRCMNHRSNAHSEHFGSPSQVSLSSDVVRNHRSVRLSLRPEATRSWLADRAGSAS